MLLVTHAMSDLITDEKRLVSLNGYRNSHCPGDCFETPWEDLLGWLLSRLMSEETSLASLLSPSMETFFFFFQSSLPPFLWLFLKLSSRLEREVFPLLRSYFAAILLIFWLLHSLCLLFCNVPRALQRVDVYSWIVSLMSPTLCILFSHNSLLAPLFTGRGISLIKAYSDNCLWL